MKNKERFIYIAIILSLGLGLFYFGFYYDDDYFELYQKEIDALSAKIDSLHNINDGLTAHIDSLNSEISALDIEIDKQDEEIDRIREDANEKTAAVDNFTVSELSEFFTNRYTAPGGQLVVILQERIARAVIKDLLLGDATKAELQATLVKLDLIEQKVVLKDSVISTLNLKLDNLNSVMSSKDQQLGLQGELVEKTRKDLRATKLQNSVLKASNAIAIVGIVLSLVL